MSAVPQRSNLLTFAKKEAEPKISWNKRDHLEVGIYPAFSQHAKIYRDPMFASLDMRGWFRNHRRFADRYDCSPYMVPESREGRDATRGTAVELLESFHPCERRSSPRTR